MKFAIFTYIEHFKPNENYYSYGPYIREMNIWIKCAEEILIIAPIKTGTPANIDEPYVHSKITFKKIPAISLIGIKGILKSIISIPFISIRIFIAMKTSDHFHIRCPGNIGLIASVLQIFFPKKIKTVKYAGNWDPNSRQPWSYKLQKWILSSAFLSKNIKVLVYGEWPNQSKNIVPFFTASFSETERVLNTKEMTPPFKFIFVGSLSVGKRPLFAVKLIEALKEKGIPVNLEIYGSGLMKNELQEYIAIKNLDLYVRLMGNLELEELKEVYKSSHFLILASQSEGWPKAIAESMFFGCIPIATPVSCVPAMLGYGERGILIDPKLDEASLKIISYLKDEKKLKALSGRAITWSNQFTLEKFENEIKELL